MKSLPLARQIGLAAVHHHLRRTGAAVAVGTYGKPVSPAGAHCQEASGSPARYLWAMLLARLFESLPLTCASCGAHMRIVAFITEAAPVARILTHIGEPAARERFKLGLHRKESTP